MPNLKSVPLDLPSPPYPEDTKVRGWRFELDHERINQSDTWALASSEMRPWLLMIWHVAWQQYPAGSLPNDDAVIAAKIGMNRSIFTANRDILMRGWVLHSDNRFYHQAIVDQVISYLEESRRERDRKRKYREKMAEMESNVPRDTHGTPTGKTLPEPEPEPVRKKTSKKKSATKIPEDWQPNDRNLSWLKSEGLHGDDIRRLVVMFRNYWLETGKKYANWDLVFQRNPVVKGEIFKLRKSPPAEPTSPARRRSLDECR